MSDLTFQDVLNILRLVDSGTFSDMQIEFDGTKLRVTRRTGTEPGGAERGLDPNRSIVRPAQPSTEPVVLTHGVGPKDSHERASASDALVRRSPDKYPNRIDVKPPMAGTYYAAPAPNAAPFVEVDRPVQKGDQLGVIEVMKLFTPVLSPCDGTVRAILVGNEEFVKSDQTLMIIQADEQQLYQGHT